MHSLQGSCKILQVNAFFCKTSCKYLAGKKDLVSSVFFERILQDPCKVCIYSPPGLLTGFSVVCATLPSSSSAAGLGLARESSCEMMFCRCDGFSFSLCLASLSRRVLLYLFLSTFCNLMGGLPFPIHCQGYTPPAETRASFHNL